MTSSQEQPLTTNIPDKYIDIIMQIIRQQNQQLLEIIMKEEGLTRIKVKIPTYWDIKTALENYSSLSSLDSSLS